MILHLATLFTTTGHTYILLVQSFKMPLAFLLAMGMLWIFWPSNCMWEPSDCYLVQTIEIPCQCMHWTFYELIFPLAKRASHINEFTLAFIISWYNVYKSPVWYFDSFIAKETYICMPSMMMLDITMEVSINKSLPIKDRPQAWLRHFIYHTFHLLAYINFGSNFWDALLFWNLG